MDTQTGVTKGTFWKFHCTAQWTAYTHSNIKSTGWAYGIIPFNPNLVLTKLQGSKTNNTRAHHATPKKTAHTFKHFATPTDRLQIRQQTQQAIEFLKAGASTDSAIEVLRKLSHQAEVSYTRT
jgi:hypothetical protein